jgi:hypothetical protein
MTTPPDAKLEKYKYLYDAYFKGDMQRKEITEKLGNTLTNHIFDYFNAQILNSDYNFVSQTEERLVIYNVLHDKYSFSPTYSNRMVSDIMAELYKNNYKIKKE